MLSSVDVWVTTLPAFMSYDIHNVDFMWIYNRDAVAIIYTDLSLFLGGSYCHLFAKVVCSYLINTVDNRRFRSTEDNCPGIS